jgi:hypothetical protein
MRRYWYLYPNDTVPVSHEVRSRKVHGDVAMYYRKVYDAPVLVFVPE